MKKHFSTALLVISILAVAIWWQPDNKDDEHAHHHAQWVTEIQKGIAAAQEWQLPDSPPEESLASRALPRPWPDRKLLHYQDDQRLPYLGSLLNVTSLRYLSDVNQALQDYPKVEKVLPLQLAPADFILVLNKGGARYFSAVDASGQEVANLETTALNYNSFADYVLLQHKDAFELYRLSTSGFNLLGRYGTESIAHSIQKEMSFETGDPSLNCSSFQFDVEADRLTIWAFNVHATVAPRAAHLIMSCAVTAEGGLLEPNSFFGQPTITERMPLPRRAQDTARSGDFFWVPRQFDPQIDIYDKKGQLIETRRLPGVLEDFYDDLAPTSPNLLGVILDSDDPHTFSHLFNRMPFITSVHAFGDDVIVERKNPGHSKQPYIYDVLHRDSGQYPLSVYSLDFGIYGTSQAGFMFPVIVKDQTGFFWADDAIQAEVDDMLQKPGLWMVTARL